MSIEFACQCGKRYRVKDSGAGRPFSCQACGQGLIVPVPDAVDLGIVTEEDAPAPPAGVAVPSRFVYRTVQLAPRIGIIEGRSHTRVAANHLQEVIDKMSGDGWDFQRIDSFAITESPGCLSAIFGGTPVSTTYYVATFRRLRASS